MATGGFILTVPVDSVVVVRQQIPAPDPECTWVQTEPSAGSPLSSFVDGQWVYSFTCSEDLEFRRSNSATLASTKSRNNLSLRAPLAMPGGAFFCMNHRLEFRCDSHSLPA